MQCMPPTYLLKQWCSSPMQISYLVVAWPLKQERQSEAEWKRQNIVLLCRLFHALILSRPKVSLFKCFHPCTHSSSYHSRTTTCSTAKASAMMWPSKQCLLPLIILCSFICPFCERIVYILLIKYLRCFTVSDHNASLPNQPWYIPVISLLKKHY